MTFTASLYANRRRNGGDVREASGKSSETCSAMRLGGGVAAVCKFIAFSVHSSTRHRSVDRFPTYLLIAFDIYKRTRWHVSVCMCVFMCEGKGGKQKKVKPSSMETM